ncbi:ABC transporter substrate-binding protein [Nocardioides pacificus]
MRPTRLIRAAAVTSACLLAITACAEDSTDTGAGDSTTPAAEFSEAPAVEATGEPIRVGWLNPSEGAYSQPGVQTGGEAALDYVNTKMGGAGGRPIEVVECDTDATPEAAQACANTFVEEGVVAVLDGYNTSSSAALPALTSAKIPLVGMIPFDSVTGSAAENRVFFAAPQASFLVGALQAFQAEGKESATLVLVDLPSSHQTIDKVLKPVGEALGIEVKGLYYSPTNPNFSAIASTIVSTNPDVGGLIASPNEATCTQLVQSLRQLGYQGTIFTAACTDHIETAPDDAAGGAAYSSNWLPDAASYAPEEVQAELAIASNAIEEHGGQAGYYAFGEFALFVNFAKALAEVGESEKELTGTVVLDTLKGLTDFPTFLGPEVTCGSKTSPNCTTEMLLFSVQDDGTIEPATGDFITPLPEVMANIPGAS